MLRPKEIASIRVSTEVLHKMMELNLDHDVMQIREDVSFLMEPNWVDMKRTMGMVIKSYSEIDHAARQQMKTNNRLLLANMFEMAAKEEQDNAAREIMYKLNPSCYIENLDKTPIAAIQLGKFGPWTSIHSLYVLPQFRKMKFASNLLDKAKHLHSNIIVKYNNTEQRKFFANNAFIAAPVEVSENLNSKKIMIWERNKAE